MAAAEDVVNAAQANFTTEVRLPSTALRPGRPEPEPQPLAAGVEGIVPSLALQTADQAEDTFDRDRVQIVDTQVPSPGDLEPIPQNRNPYGKPPGASYQQVRRPLHIDDSGPSLNHIDTVLRRQFGQEDDGDISSPNQPPTEPEETSSKETMQGSQPGSFQSAASSGSSSPQQKSGFRWPDCRPCRRRVQAVAENRWVTSFFMSLTFYALFAPDIDQVAGNGASEVNLSIATTVVFFLFCIELFAHAFTGMTSVYRAYFWLDLVAALSLLPDTYLAQALVTDNAFAAGRSTRLTRLMRVAARSSRAARLNRLTRIVRVASLMPRMASLILRRVNRDDSTKLVDKKLRCIFDFLDEDTDGRITTHAACSCMFKLKELFPGRRRSLWRRGVSPEAAGNTATTSPISPSGKARGSCPKPFPSSMGDVDAPYSGYDPGPRRVRFTQGGDEGLPNNMGLAGSMESTAGFGDVDPPYSDEDPGARRVSQGVDPTDDAMPPSSLSCQRMSRSLSRTERLSRWFAGYADGTRTSYIANALGGGQKDRMTSVASVDSISSGAAEMMKRMSGQLPLFSEDSVTLLTYPDFRACVLSDETVSAGIQKVCKKQLMTGHSLRNVTTRHTEEIGVKVALGVLVLLFVLSVVEPNHEDIATALGFNHLDALVRVKLPNRSSAPIPEFVHEQVCLWIPGVSAMSGRKKLVFLDLDEWVYCDSIGSGNPCPTVEVCGLDSSDSGRPTVGSLDWWWGSVGSRDSLQRDAKASNFRFGDFVFLQYPEEAEEVRSLAVVQTRLVREDAGRVSLITTSMVLLIILLGIGTLTRDFTRLTTTLLRPLKELADEMENVTHLQLDGVGGGVAAASGRTPRALKRWKKGTSEIQVIRKTFDNMKKAIKSWGKYVPWPVVQALLNAGRDAANGVEELEVTVFFSDIAGFTTIVESIAPESSLLLLSRYFNTMSKVMDLYGGVVLEYIGDAIMGIWGAPLLQADHSASAVKAALRMLESCKRINATSMTANPPLPNIHIRCGIHTGKMLVGNMGFASRLKYGIVGEEASIPSRLEEMNKRYGTSMLISSSLHGRLPSDEFVSRPIDFVRLRTTPGALAGEFVYEVLDRHRRTAAPSKFQEPVDLHAKAIALYMSRDFAVAADVFDEVGQRMHELTGVQDSASLVLSRRCRDYIEKPPPEGWTGIAES
eukprot:TRINITY_DN7055_c0_g1_i4.p1 TRINITY_DN7055_c0_g1~~TRINITY_DN7055_c0_g1_i4.p1  ORF type:complete len:1180 (-),score=200.87 TRINITY_DN7055_c0_g1_i4:76-3615(-)